MPDILREFYQNIESTLRLIVNQPPACALDDNLFRSQVIERGWHGLPKNIQAMGRAQLRWDEILLVLRREVYSNEKGKLVLRPDASARIFSALSQLLGSSEATAPPPARPASAAPVKAAPAAPVAVPVQATPVAPPQGALVKPARTAPAAAAAAPAKPAAPSIPAVGIDLGTTYSVVAHLDAHGRPVTIPNAAGELLTPSVLLFEDSGVVVGKEAVMAAGMEPEKVADCFKRDMGAKVYRRKVNGRELPPEVLSAFVLRSLRADAERKLGTVRKAVITVPAYFDEARRQATMDAGKLAGLDVLDIINEPTAAAIAYGYQVGFLDRQGSTPGDRPVRVLVYDLGGGTFDVTILEVKGTSFKAIATDGDVYLGGKDWDEKLMTLAAERFRKQVGQDPRKTPALEQELWIAVEGAKRTLSERNKAALYLNIAGKRAKVELTREEFEEATAALLDRTRTTCEIVIRQSGLRWADIDKVLLVGGSTRMPMVSRMLQEVTGKTPDRSVNPDEAVAHGAALYADLVLRRQGGASATRFSITNINSHSLGIVGIDPGTKQRKNQILIAKNTPLPQTVTRVFRTLQKGQPLVTIRVVEGESERPEACSQVGVLTIRDLPANLPEGWPVQVSYSYQENGQLQVTAKLQGHPSIVTTYFLRENSLQESDFKSWNEFINKEWSRRKD